VVSLFCSEPQSVGRGLIVEITSGHPCGLPALACNDPTGLQPTGGLGLGQTAILGRLRDWPPGEWPAPNLRLLTLAPGLHTAPLPRPGPAGADPGQGAGGAIREGALTRGLRGRLGDFWRIGSGPS